MKSLLPITTIVATLLGAGAALAAPAMATSTLNLRTGPGIGYPVETAMPAGAVVDVAGCTRGYGWCRVNWNGYEGWVVSDYLAYRDGRYHDRRFSTYGAEIGIPLIAGAIIGGAFLGHHDHERPAWHDRHRNWRYDRRHHEERRHRRSRDDRHGRADAHDRRHADSRDGDHRRRWPHH